VTELRVLPGATDDSDPERLVVLVEAHGVERELATMPSDLDRIASLEAVPCAQDVALDYRHASSLSLSV